LNYPICFLFEWVSSVIYYYPSRWPGELDKAFNPFKTLQQRAMDELNFFEIAFEDRKYLDVKKNLKGGR
jgi:hypothetical protein